MLADVETNDALPADELQLCPSEFGPLAIFPDERHPPAHRGDNRAAGRRRSVARARAEDPAPNARPTGIEARALHWSSYFRIHHRHVAQLRVGRMFIAGDAAHIHSPFGGQGMNTGLHDVWNLVWKLDLVLHGRGNDRLLESYSAERLPVIKQVIETTAFPDQGDGNAKQVCAGSARHGHPDGVAPGAISARLRSAALGARHCLSRKPDRRRAPESGTSTIRCAAAMAFAAASCSSSRTKRTRRSGTRRNSSPHPLRTFSNCDCGQPAR